MKHLKAGFVGSAFAFPFVVAGSYLTVYLATKQLDYLALSIIAYFSGAVADAVRSQLSARVGDSIASKNGK